MVTMGNPFRTLVALLLHSALLVESMVIIGNVKTEAERSSEEVKLTVILERHSHLEFVKRLEDLLNEKASRGLGFADGRMDLAELHHEPNHTSRYVLFQTLFALSSGDPVYRECTVELLRRALPHEFGELRDLITNHFRLDKDELLSAIRGYFDMTNKPGLVTSLMCNISNVVFDHDDVFDDFSKDTLVSLAKLCLKEPALKEKLITKAWEKRDMMVVNVILDNEVLKKPHLYFDLLSKLFANETFLKYFINTQSDENILYVIENYEFPVDIFVNICLKQNKISVLRYLMVEDYISWENVVDKEFFTDIIAHNKLAVLRDILDIGFPINTADEEGATLLYRSFQLENKLMTGAIIGGGGNVNATSGCSRPLLHTAVATNMTNIAKELVKYGADMNARDCFGLNVIQAALLTENATTIADTIDLYKSKGISFDNDVMFFAAVNGSENAIVTLIGKDFDVNVENAEGHTPLEEAILSCKRDNIQVLEMYNGVVKNSRNVRDYLAVALRCNDTEIVKYVLENVVQPNETLSDQSKYLKIALENRNSQVLRLLLNLGMNANTDIEPMRTDAYPGTPPLVYAIKNDDVESMDILTGAGATIDFPDNSNSLRTTSLVLLHKAAEYDATRALTWLLDRGRPVDEASRDGSTALMIAAGRGYTRVVEELLRRGAAPDAKNGRSETALMLAAANGHLFAARALLAGGAAVGAQDAQHGQAPLHWAARFGHQSVVMELLDRGADIAAVNADGDTALHVAAAHGWLPVVMELIERGAELNPKNAKGWTPLKCAIEGHHSRIVRALEFRGGLQ